MGNTFVALYIVGSLLAVVSLVLALTYDRNKRDVSSKLTTPLNAMPTYQHRAYDENSTVEMENASWVNKF